MDFKVTHQAVIFSVFEGQYNGCVYTDNENSPTWALLQTPFLQHCIAGEPTEKCGTVLDDIIFTEILNEQSEKEIVVFFASGEWNSVLEGIFTKRGGVSELRKIFSFSEENFREFRRLPIPEDVQAVAEKCKPAPNSRINTWSAKVLSKGKTVSHCDALMVGKGMAEIDIGTEEAFRGKGYATIAAALLIDRLLEEGLTPCWSTWPFRLESQHIAGKLGFVPQPDVTAWIWMEGM